MTWLVHSCFTPKNSQYLALRLHTPFKNNNEMEKSNHLRNLMKEAAKGASGNVSGKEKAKMLKEAREKKRLESEAIDKKSVTTSTLKRTLPNVDNNNANSVLKEVRKIALPLVQPVSSLSSSETGGNKNDVPKALVSAAKILSSKADSPMGSFHVADVVDTDERKDKARNQSVEVPRATTIINDDNSIPKNFFDNIAEDYHARGLSLKKEIEKKEKQQDQELRRFLEEVEGIEADSEDILEQIEHDQERESEGLQLAYMTKLASLMHSTTEVLKRRKVHQDSSESTPDMELTSEVAVPISTLSEDSRLAIASNSFSADPGTSAIPTEILSVEDAVKLAISREKGAKRKAREMGKDSDYRPLAVDDWTALTL